MTSAEMPRDIDHHEVSARVVTALHQHSQTPDGRQKMVRQAVQQVPGLDVVLYPALRIAGLDDAIPQLSSTPE